MGSLTDTAEIDILDHVFRNTAMTSPTTVYAALFSAAPSDAAGGTELTGNGYTRIAITMGAAAAGAISNSAAVTFPTATGSNWAAATHFAIFDAATVGNMIAWGTLDASRTVLVGDNAEFAIAALAVTMD